MRELNTYEKIDETLRALIADFSAAYKTPIVCEQSAELYGGLVLRFTEMKTQIYEGLCKILTSCAIKISVGNSDDKELKIPLPEDAQRSLNFLKSALNKIRTDKAAELAAARMGVDGYEFKAEHQARKQNLLVATILHATSSGNDTDQIGTAVKIWRQIARETNKYHDPNAPQRIIGDDIKAALRTKFYPDEMEHWLQTEAVADLINELDGKGRGSRD